MGRNLWLPIAVVATAFGSHLWGSYSGQSTGYERGISQGRAEMLRDVKDSFRYLEMREEFHLGRAEEGGDKQAYKSSLERKEKLIFAHGRLVGKSEEQIAREARMAREQGLEADD